MAAELVGQVGLEPRPDLLAEPRLLGRVAEVHEADPRASARALSRRPRNDPATPSPAAPTTIGRRARRAAARSRRRREEPHMSGPESEPIVPASPLAGDDVRARPRTAARPARGGARRGEARDRRSGRDARARARLPRRRRPPPDRGRARPRQDADDQDDRRRARRLVPADPVHARPRPVRPRRDARLPPRPGRVRDRSRPGLLQLPPRRRDQPRAGEGAVGAARGDAGAPGDDRPRHAHRPGAVPRDGDAEPDRVGGHVSRFRRRRSTASCSRCSSATRSATRS